MATSTKGQEESTQKAKEMAPPPLESNESKRKLPVGAYVSSVHVDYESFEVGTGQVSLHIDLGYILRWSHVSVLFGLALNYLFNSIFVGMQKTDFLLVKIVRFFLNV